ncbi:MAG: hypothetical protein JXL80_15430 [Planctomycetes bacterium]|nr:hypothetical protein [Planctomycetota bacterium]
MAKDSRKASSAKGSTVEELRKPRTARQVAELLSADGGTSVTEDQVRGLVDRGAPTGKDGRIDLLTLAAWMVRESADGEA